MGAMIPKRAFRGGHAHACDAQRHRDRPVRVCSAQVDAPQRIEHRFGRMTVVVASADADHRRLRTHSSKKAGRVRVPTVMGHLEHRGAQAIWPGEHMGLGRGFGVASEQHGAFGPEDAENE
jgi:hypothetical protein